MSHSEPNPRVIRRNFWFCKELAERKQGCSHAELVLLLLLCEAQQEELTRVYVSEQYGLRQVLRRFDAGSTAEARRRG